MRGPIFIKTHNSEIYTYIEALYSQTLRLRLNYSEISSPKQISINLYKLEW